MIDIERVPQRSEVGNLEAEFSGVAEGLMRALTPFDVIDDTTLEREPLGRYAALFLPNVAAMSDEVAARLRDYVRRGGSSVAVLAGRQAELLHLVNFTGEMTRPIRKILPISNAQVTVSGIGPVKKVQTLVRGEQLHPVARADGRVEFVVPRVDEYEVVVLE